MPDNIVAAFAGGGKRWLIEVRFEQHSHYYQFAYGRGKDQYVRSRKEYGHSTDSSDIHEVRNRLKKILSELIDLANTTPETQHWADNFQAALFSLQKEEYGNTVDFIPENFYSNEASGLLEAAYGSWVFGGMGSWNDVVFQGDDHSLYEKLTPELYDIICSALVAVVNSDSVSR